MKLKPMLMLAALMALAVGADAQVKHAPVKTKPAMDKKMPMRDPKTGKFVKKAMPMRDPKTGRFMKSHVKTTKPGPARDPKTGRFIKKKP